MTIQELISKHHLNQTYLAGKLNVSKQTFANKLKDNSFTASEAIILRDYIVDLGIACLDIFPVSFDGTMSQILKK